jgi:hypothetical protein
MHLYLVAQLAGAPMLGPALQPGTVVPVGSTGQLKLNRPEWPNVVGGVYGRRSGTQPRRGGAWKGAERGGDHSSAPFIHYLEDRPSGLDGLFVFVAPLRLKLRVTRA